MKKMFLFLMFSIISFQAFGQFTTVWQKSQAAGNLTDYAWFTSTASEERGMAYGLVAGNHRIFVVDRTDNSIKIINATTGADVGTLNTTGTSGLVDVEVSDDGIIFACQFANSASASFKIWRWDTEASAPVLAVDATSEAATFIRLGDKFNVVGSVSDNTAKIYAGYANFLAVLNQTKIRRWEMSSGSFVTPSTDITINILASAPGSIMVAPVSSSTSADFYFNASGYNAAFYTSSGGNNTGTIPGGVLSTGSHAIRYFESGADKFIVSFQTGVSNHNARIVNVTSGAAAGTSYGVTATLGGNANVNGTGDVDIKNNGDGTFDVFVLATNNGIGCYRTSLSPLPVELTSFTSTSNGNAITLNWATATEVDNYGFEVECSADNTTFTKVGFVAGAGNSNVQKQYSFVDGNLTAGNYYYRLKQVDTDGSFEYSQVVSSSVSETPATFSLEQNYPNPFNPSTKISFALAKDSDVKLTVFNTLGEEVAVLVNSTLTAGTHSVDFNATNLTSGMYLYKIQAGSFVATKKMVLTK